MTSPSPSPSTRQWRVEGEEGNEANWDRAYALSYVMSPFQGLRCTQQIYPLSMHAISPILCHYGTRYPKCGSYRCQYCRCKIPQKLYQPCFVLLSHFSTDFHWLIFKFIITEFLGTDYHCFLFLSTDYHRLTQIFKYQRYFNYHRLLSLIFPFFNLSIFQSNQSLWLLICANLWNLWSIKNIAQLLIAVGYLLYVRPPSTKSPC